MHHTNRRWLFPALAALVIVALLVKYFWSMWLYPTVPFGYDAGIYRFLFQRFSESLPPFGYSPLAAWTKEHAPGLFFFSSLLIKAGMTPDMLIGWVWNLIPVLIACGLALIVRRKHGNIAGLFTLVAALLSVVQYEGFLLMYYKVLVGLFFCAVAFDMFERKSPWFLVFGMLTIATHQQIGLIFLAATGASLLSARLLRNEPFPWSRVGELLLTMVLGLAWYAPHYQSSILGIVPRLIESGTLLGLVVAIAVLCGFYALVILLPKKDRRVLWIACALLCGVLIALLPVIIDSPDLIHKLLNSNDTQPGNFISMTEYLMRSLPLLLAGVTGLVLSLEKERGTPWQWAVLCCAIASIGMLFFYRRFLLPLDFFLLPFVAIAFTSLFKGGYQSRLVLVVLIAAQAALLVYRLSWIDPKVDPVFLEKLKKVHLNVYSNQDFIVLDLMTPWVVGYLPYNNVSGPGLFDSRSRADWERFLLGNDSDRQWFLDGYKKGTYFYATNVFYEYYPPEIESLLTHKCFESIPQVKGLYRSKCGI